MLAWMLYAIMVSLLLSAGAFLAERAARLKRIGTRWIWLTAIVMSLALPTLISSVAFELPSVVDDRVVSRFVVLRQATSEHLSPAMWIAGSPAPAGWRSADDLVEQLWRSVSIAMLLALIASGVHLFVRKRNWGRDMIAGASVYVTADVGPAVVGLLRPRIAVPRWVHMAPPSHQAAVIAHEQSHLDAHDPQLFTFALGLLVFMPWNLPLWWQLRRLRYAIEIDCDARVLAGGVDPAHYGETLIAVGERQSAYVGAVAAMSESKSFLEERIEHMIRKPQRWRRLGVATLASLSIALTALAAQVSPPNADSPAPVSGSTTKKNREAIKLPGATLDRYVGTYKFGDAQILTVSRKGDGLQAQLTGQPAFEIFAEGESSFFYKIVDAQVDFETNGGMASAVVLRQGGGTFRMPRIDDASVAQIKADVAARIAANSPTPGSEAAVRKMASSFAAGLPNYEDMEPDLANATRAQADHLKTILTGMGAVRSVEFQRVGDGGWDVYRVIYEQGALLWRIGLAPNGKVAYALAMPDA